MLARRVPRPGLTGATPETAAEFIRGMLEAGLAGDGLEVAVEPMTYPAGSKIPLIIRVKGAGEYLYWYYPGVSDRRMKSELAGALDGLNARVSGGAA